MTDLPMFRVSRSTWVEGARLIQAFIRPRGPRAAARRTLGLAFLERVADTPGSTGRYCCAVTDTGAKCRRVDLELSIHQIRYGPALGCRHCRVHTQAPGRRVVVLAQPEGVDSQAPWARAAILLGECLVDEVWVRHDES